MLPNTAMAVSIDTGDAVELHPKNKKPIGIRHAYLALKQTYGKDLVDYGPRYKKQTVQGATGSSSTSIPSAAVWFTAKPGKLDTFAIAGADQKCGSGRMPKSKAKPSLFLRRKYRSR